MTFKNIVSLNKLFYRFVFLVLLLLHGTVKSQIYNFRHYSVNNGLPQSYVYTSAQDNKGYIWLGTSDGLARFDGQVFKVYSKKDGLGENNISCSYKAANGNIFYGHANGMISLFDWKKQTFSILKNKFSNSSIPVYSLFGDSKGRLWVATLGNGFYVLDTSTGELLIEGQDIQDKIILGFTEDKSGNVWIAGKRGLAIVKNNKPEYLDATASSSIPVVYCDQVGNMWISIQKKGLFVLSPSLQKEIIGGKGKDFLYKNAVKVPVKNIDKGNYVHCIYEDSEHNIWFGTALDGLFKFIPDKKASLEGNIKRFSTENGLSNDFVWTINEDRENNIWVGTLGGGVSIITKNDERFTLYKTENGLSHNSIWNIVEDANNRFWIATEDGLCSAQMINGELHNFKVYTTKDGLGSNQVSFLYCDHQNNIWGGFDNNGRGVFKMDTRKGKISVWGKKEGFSDISSIVEDKENNLWFGTYVNGIIKYDPETKDKTFFNKNNGLASNKVISLFRDRKGNVWIATEGGGISCYNGHKLLTFGKENGLLHDDFYCITEDKKGRIWCGSQDGGAYCYDGKKFKRYSSSDGLSSDAIFSIVSDRKGNIWLGSSKGLDKLNLSNDQITHYAKQEGFTGVENNLNAVYRDRTGCLWFGTIDGLIKYNPAKDPPNLVEPLTFLTGLKIFLKPTPFPKNNEFGYKQNYITFEYIGLSFSIPEKNRYQFMLEGFDPEWSPVTSRTDVTYSNLPPGNYVFKVKASNGDGYWKKKPFEYHFSIKPPFWKTIWFYILLAVVFIAGIYAFVTLRTKNLRKAKLMLEKQVRERTKEVIEQKEEIEKQKVLVEHKNLELNQKNKDITDSIQYAKRIQLALLPQKEQILKKLPASFVIYKPKDIVSGDFYWYSEKDNVLLFAVADCTGHGVPGAFMSILGNTALNEIINEKGVYDPSRVLSSLDINVTNTLKQKTGEDSETRDGMDISFCKFDLNTSKLSYAGANRPLFLIKNKELTEVKGDHYAIGGHYETMKEFTEHTFEIEPGDSIYLYSDGVVDQFGGPKGKKFMTKQLKEVLLSVCDLPAGQQEKKLREIMDNWRGNMEQIDDILLLGIRF